MNKFFTNTHYRFDRSFCTHSLSKLNFKSYKNARWQSFALFLLVFAPLMLMQGGCAKHPSATSPIINKAETKGDAVVNTARSMMGTRYKNGGSNTEGFDCSGFVSWTFAKYGTKMPRTAIEQASAGKKIQREELKPGDVVVFQISKRRGYHSGIYTGEGNFIHSPRKGESIREDSISSKYWDKKFIAARRVLP